MGLQYLYQTYDGNFKNTFCFEPPKKNSTMPPDYKTGIDTTELWNDDEKEQYRQCIGDM